MKIMQADYTGDGVIILSFREDIRFQSITGFPLDQSLAVYKHSDYLNHGWNLRAFKQIFPME